jgi:hypothetical protein
MRTSPRPWLARLVLALLGLLAVASPAHAHALRARWVVREGKLEVTASYDDESVPEGASVKLLDGNGTVVARGETDANGHWSCPAPGPGRYRLIVDAGAGHRTEKFLEAPDEPASRVKSLGLGLAVIATLATAAWLVLRRRARPGPP